MSYKQDLFWYRKDPAFIAISRNIKRKYPSMPAMTVESKTLQIMVKEKRLVLKPLTPPYQAEPAYQQLSLF